MTDLSTKRIVVTGGAGFLGRAVCRTLVARGVAAEQITVPRRRDFDLTIEADVVRLYETARPEVVIHLAAEVGGIGANMAHPGRFFYANMAMGLHLVEHARRIGLEKFVHTGTVCAYPKHAAIPFREDDIWNGYPEETNAPYGVAKKAVFVMLDGYRREYGLRSAVAVPVNLYGPADNFDPASSHVIPALIRKCEEARLAGAEEVVCWGTGGATREFLYVDDAAEGIVRAAEIMEEPVPINLGGGQEIAIRDLVGRIAAACGYEGRISWDTTKPDGQPRRALDIARARELLGWQPHQDFDEGLAATVAWWRSQSGQA
ncbi:MAG: GDP-L-fucose synthase [Planctomycetota bacterium]|jgi:GDP-L-fucose synthase|nr:GDP-L-fucose synthase [Planctomycetota bacterium]MDA1201510.1 GDP-L-fucose synthase [Planctomycetota bacterium]